MAYTALAQDATPDTSADLGRLHLRLSSDDAAVPVALRAAVQRVHPRLVLRTVTRLEDDINRTLGSERFFATLLGAFSALALGLAAIGLYGVMAYATRRRTREIGVRMAMGATGAAVVAMVLREALAMALVGVLIGVPAALYGARFMEGLLYGLTAADPLTLAGVVLLIGAVALIAAWLPARRAATVDPNAALRCE
jgi:putative ABC transport system permease protein